MPSQKEIVKSLIRLAELCQLAEKIAKKRTDFILYVPSVKQSGEFLHIQFRNTNVLIGKTLYHFDLMNYLEVIDTSRWEVKSILKQTGPHGDMGYEIICQWIAD